MKTKLINVNVKLDYNFVALIYSEESDHSGARSVLNYNLKDIMYEAHNSNALKINVSRINCESDVCGGYELDAIPWSLPKINNEEKTIRNLLEEQNNDDIPTVLRFLFRNEEEIVKRHGKEEFDLNVQSAIKGEESIKKIKDRLGI
jgi:hypothetical protein